MTPAKLTARDTVDAMPTTTLSAMDFTKRGVMRTAVRIGAMRSVAAG
jgi:hypothetical protein